MRTLGCKVNRVESEQIAATLLAGGFSLVEDDAADVIVINTCTVTGEADSKARKLIRQELKREREPVVVVTGCLVAVDADAVESLGDRVVSIADKSRVAEYLIQAFGQGTVTTASAPRSGRGFRTRAMVKVQDGCDRFCSYCIVPSARGLPRSVDRDEILREVEDLLESGVNEIVLTGVNLGRYASRGHDLSDLIAVIAGAGVRRLRLSSIEPLDLTERLLEVLGSTPAVCPHLHVPLQSGSDRVLEAMQRRYDLATYRRRIDAARDAIPGLAVTTDVIAGFPGEREEDFRATLEACERIGFARLHVFRYSERGSTVAASLADPVPQQERARRASALRELDRALRASYARSRMGGVGEVLVEELVDDSDGAGLAALGTTEDYLRVSFAAKDARVADIVPVTIGHAGANGVLRGVPIESPPGIE